MTLANILDPIHDTLDPTVFESPDQPEPRIKPVHRKWIMKTIYKVLDDAGYDGMENWLQLVFTGSLTTYQYSPESDVDISLFVNVEKFPEWSRAEMIGEMIENIDGLTLPGTTHPMQAFVVPGDVKMDDLYRPGLRSGYDLEDERWIVPPERGRVKDVQAEMNAAYVHAMEQADKMDRLLRYEPDKAVIFWHQIHKRRQRDHKAGKGDYSESNITYKMLANRGLFPQIAEVSGEYIAKVSGMCPTCGATLNPSDSVCPQCLAPAAPQGTTDWHAMPHMLNQPVAQRQGGTLPPPEAIERARQELGLQHPVRVLPTYKNRGGYAGISRDPMSGKPSHLVYVNPEQQPGPRNWSLWHELGHAKRIEEGGEFSPNNEMSTEEYAQDPNELHAEDIANQYADDDLYTAKQADKRKQKSTQKWVFQAEHGLVMGDMGPEEGALPTHAQLASQAGFDRIDHAGTFSPSGYVQFEAGVGNDRSRYLAQQALREALGDQLKGILGGELSNLWDFASAQAQPQNAGRAEAHEQRGEASETDGSVPRISFSPPSLEEIGRSLRYLRDEAESEELDAGPHRTSE